MSAADTLQTALQNLSINKEGSSTLNKRDLKLVLEAFSAIDGDRRNVSLAYAYLASILLGTGNPAGSTSLEQRRDAKQYIRTLLSSWLSETSFQDLSKAFAALTAILEVDKATFEEYLHASGMEERILEAGEIICASYRVVDPEEYAQVKFCLAAFINQAAGQATPLAKKLANPDNSNWLYKRLMDEQDDVAIRAASAVAFIKLQNVAPRAGIPAVQAGSDATPLLMPTTEVLLQVFKQAISPKESSNSHRAVQLGLEGLGVSTLKPTLRRLISDDVEVIKTLLNLARLSSRQYSTAVIFANLVTYPRELGDDDRMKASIRQYASRGNAKEEEQETKEEMDKRCTSLLHQGVMPVVVAYSKASSVAIIRLCGQILLGLVENVKNRGVVIQQGGAKALLEVIVKSSIYQKPNMPLKEDFTAVQALAKLLITANPLLVLGPTPQSPLLIAVIQPLASPILHEGSTLLQRFESLMALTNITSLSEELQERLSSLPDFLDKVETIIIESDSSLGDIMCRRAAVELICNLASSETSFIRFTAIDKEADLKEGQLPGSVASRINILLALSDSEDGSTREAALGALATFTLAPTVARYITKAESRYNRIVEHLSREPSEAGMQLRAIECLKNIASSDDALVSVVQKALKERARHSTDSEVKSAVAEALQDLSRHPQES